VVERQEQFAKNKAQKEKKDAEIKDELIAVPLK